MKAGLTSAFRQGLARALSGSAFKNRILSNAADRYVSNAYLVDQITEYCAKFGYQPCSSHIVGLIEEIKQIRPAFSAQ